MTCRFIDLFLFLRSIVLNYFTQQQITGIYRISKTNLHVKWQTNSENMIRVLLYYYRQERAPSKAHFRVYFNFSNIFGAIMKITRFSKCFYQTKLLDLWKIRQRAKELKSDISIDLPIDTDRRGYVSPVHRDVLPVDRGSWVTDHSGRMNE